MDQRICCIQPFPDRLDTTEAVDDPLVAIHQCHVRPQILFVRDRDTSRTELKFIEHLQRQAGRCSQRTGKRRLAATGISEYRHALHAAQQSRSAARSGLSEVVDGILTILWNR